MSDLRELLFDLRPESAHCQCTLSLWIGAKTHAIAMCSSMPRRDFFRLYCEKHGDSVFKLTGPIGLDRPWFNDEHLLQRWKDGRLGVPLVDANMRELAATGFMSNRGRQNVASYLALDLGLDWRQGICGQPSPRSPAHAIAPWRPPSCHGPLQPTTR